MAAKTTRATDALDAAGIQFRLHGYDVDEAVGDGYGEAVAEAIGMPGTRVFKTLVAEVDEETVVAIIPVTQRLSLKRLAAAADGKRASLASPVTVERVTGYVTGGISPFGQRRPLRFFVDATALGFETVAVSGGRRGLQVELAPEALLEVTGAAVSRLTED